MRAHCLLCLILLLAVGCPASAFLAGPSVGRQNVSVVERLEAGQPSLLEIAAKTPRASVGLQTLLAAGRCEDFEQSPLMCQYALIGAWKPVWTAPSLGLTQEYWQAQMHGAAQSSDSTFVSYLDVISSLPYDGCAQAYSRLICPTFFPPCIPNPDPATSGVISVLPMPVCRSVCEAANDACRSYRNGADLVDCVSAVSPLTGGAQWPEDSLECTTNSAVIFFKEERPDEDQQAGNTTLAKDTVDTDPYGLEFSCPTPLIFYPEIPDQYTGLACSTTCHKKMHLVAGKEDFEAYYIATSVFYWISFVCVNILIITILLFPTQRKFPTLVVLFIAIGLWFFHVGAVGMTFIGIDDTLCKDKTEVMYGISYCGFFSWAFFFGGLFVIIWWTYMAFIIFYNVGLQQTHEDLDEKLFPFLCVFGWVYPVVASIVVALVEPEDNGTAGLFAWCWIALKHSIAHENLVWGLFFPWAFIGAVLVPIFITGSLGRLCYQGKKSTMNKRSIIQFSLLMSIFCVYFFLTLVLAIVGEFYFTQSDVVPNAIKNWHLCLFSGRVATSDCPKPPNTLAPLYWLEGIFYSLCGTVLFICFFVLRERTWRCWQVAITNLREGRPFFDGLSSHTHTTGRDSNRQTASSNQRASGGAASSSNID